jgi:hypothetical protein
MTLSELTRSQQIFGLVIGFRDGLIRLLGHRYFVAGCLALGVSLRLTWLLLFAPQPVSDFRWYYERAIDLAAGRGYAVTADTYWPDYMIPPVLISPEDGRVPTAFWPVGYPAFLAGLFVVTGPSLWAAKLANVLLYSGVLMLTYVIALKLQASRIVAGAAMLLLAIYPDHIAYSSLLATEILFLFLLLLGVALLLLKNNAWTVFSAGIVFGLAGLVKPQVIVVPALCLIALAMGRPHRRLSVRDGVVLYAALSLTLVPWLIRNGQVFDQFVFISNNVGYNLYVGNNPQATGGYSLSQEMIDRFADVPGEADRNRLALQLAAEFIGQHPVDAVALWPAKLWHLFGKDIRGIFWNEQGLTENSSINKLLHPLKIVAQLYYIAILILFTAALFVMWHKTSRRQTPVVGLVICLYFTVIHLFTFGESRFHFAMMPWVMIVIATLILPQPQLNSVGDQ